MKWMLDSFPDLVPKDPNRAFSESERIVIWRKAFMKCQGCGIQVGTLSEMHADHIVPHSKGGITTIDNAQCLCSPCNLRKSNN
jgi:5-methylcytosine-specific restriction endonuclease McrA